MQHHRFIELTDRTILFLVVLLGAMMVLTAVDARASSQDPTSEVETHQVLETPTPEVNRGAKVRKDTTPTSPFSALRKAMR